MWDFIVDNTEWGFVILTSSLNNNIPIGTPHQFIGMVGINNDNLPNAPKEISRSKAED
jgi:hypothetical protein